MTITQKLQTEFPGIAVIVTAIIGALKAVYVYNRALKAIEALKKKDSVNVWVWNVSEHSMLSYADAQNIYDSLSKYPGICKYSKYKITEFVIEMANCGQTADTIIMCLLMIERDFDQRASKELSIRL